MKHILSLSLIAGALTCASMDAIARRAPDPLAICEKKGVVEDIYHYLKCLFKPLKALILKAPQLFTHHQEHEKDACRIRLFNNYELCPEETQFLQNRSRITQSALERFCHCEDSEHQAPRRLPRIALCFSGGGFRSMILTLGFLAGAEESGLLDCMTYIAGLSGSTWAMAPWLASGKNLQEITKNLQKQTPTGLNHLITDHNRLKEVAETIFRKIKHDQRISLIDIYGPLMANTLLGDLGERRLTTTLSESHKHIIAGNLPMPIYTAINVHTKPYDWFEITPFEVSSLYLKAAVPTWAYGRKFKNGISTNEAPEQTLGYMLGIFGSAFEVNAREIIHYSIESLKDIKTPFHDLYAKLRESLMHLINRSIIDDARMFPSHLRNFTYGMASSPTKDQKMISLVDAGLDFNLPVPPLLHEGRSVDIIIIYDASADIVGTPELKRAESYAREHHYAFPTIDYTGADQRPVSVFSNPDDPHCPTVIYFPRIKNPAYSAQFDPEKCVANDYCGTFNFNYLEHQFKELFGLAAFTVKQQIDVIRKAIIAKTGQASSCGIAEPCITPNCMH